MQGQFEEARSIRRKTRKGGISRITEQEKNSREKSRIEREIEETSIAINHAQTEAEEYNVKLKEVKGKLKNTLYDSKLDLEEKARRVAELKAKQENCEFIIRQATARWAKLTDKKRALEKELKEIIDSE